jgi:putative oxidoreductase
MQATYQKLIPGRRNSRGYISNYLRPRGSNGCLENCAQVGYAMSSVTAIPVGKHAKPVSWPVRMCRGFYGGGAWLQSPFMLTVRLYWGWQFAQTGWGKLHHLAQVTDFFRSLGITVPAFSAPFVSGLEFAGGLLLLAGLASRLTSFLLAANMFVAYWTADHGALLSVFSDPGKFYGADPYTFLFASLLVLVFGAGCFSLDAAIAKRWRKRA